MKDNLTHEIEIKEAQLNIALSNLKKYVENRNFDFIFSETEIIKKLTIELKVLKSML